MKKYRLDYQCPYCDQKIEYNSHKSLLSHVFDCSTWFIKVNCPLCSKAHGYAVPIVGPAFSFRLHDYGINEHGIEQ